MTVPASTQSRLSSILGEFRAPIRFAFAYGSGVFPQHASGPEHSRRPAIPDGATGEPKKMVDLVLAVSHPEHWHGLNRAQFPAHYSTMSRSTLLGAEFLAGWVQRAGAGLWYMPYVRMGGSDDGSDAGSSPELVKYGVVNIDTLCADLLDWDTLYLSGRMHKPVAMVVPDARVRLAQQVNLASALRVALLLLPQHFDEVQLYTQIASLSYMGDFRMSVPGGENANKVRNIVLAQRAQFRGLYAGLLRSMGTVEVEVGERSDNDDADADAAATYTMTQDTSPAVRAALAARLPLRLRQKLTRHYLARPHLHEAFAALARSGGAGAQPGRATLSGETSGKTRTRDGDEGKDAHTRAFWQAATSHPSFRAVLCGCIAATVKGPAWSQSVKGVYTAGLARTARYVLAKVGKWFEGRR